MANSILDFEKQITPYYTSSHEEYRLHVRKFRETHFDPYIAKWIKCEGHNKGIEGVRDYVRKQVAWGGIYLFPWSYGTWIDSNGVKQKWDPFYLIVFAQEMNKHGFDLGTHIISMAIGPLYRFASNAVHRNALNEMIAGTKLVALAISELSGGSDVAQITTTAEKTADGQHYTVNGNKYWITTGHRADYFVTLVRTKPIDTGRHGVSLLLIPRCKGVFTSKIQVQGTRGSDIAAVTFANVKVPVANLIYEENKGFVPLMTNFNRERFIICAGVVANSRLCVTEAIEWAKERKTFGKRLIDHQVIKHKIATMSRRVLACQSFLERVAYQMKYDPYGSKDKSVVRNVSLLKVECSQCFQYCTIEASQIFGGRSYVRGGRGGVVERLYRVVRQNAIAGGSEEIMLDLAMRQAKL